MPEWVSFSKKFFMYMLNYTDYVSDCSDRNAIITQESIGHCNCTSQKNGYIITVSAIIKVVWFDCNQM